MPNFFLLTIFQFFGLKSSCRRIIGNTNAWSLFFNILVCTSKGIIFQSLLDFFPLMDQNSFLLFLQIYWVHVTKEAESDFDRKRVAVLWFLHAVTKHQLFLQNIFAIPVLTVLRHCCSARCWSGWAQRLQGEWTEGWEMAAGLQLVVQIDSRQFQKNIKSVANQERNLLAKKVRAAFFASLFHFTFFLIPFF